MHTLSVNDNELNFKVLEQTIYRIVCEAACEVMKDMLEQIDLMLLAKRELKNTAIKVLEKLAYIQL